VILMCRVTQVITSQTLSPKKVVTNELRTFCYEDRVTRLFSTWNDFRGLIDSLICRGKVNDVGYSGYYAYDNFSNNY